MDTLPIIKNLLYFNVGGLVEYFDYTKEKVCSGRGGIKFLLSENTSLEINTGLYTQFPIQESYGSYGPPPFLENSNLKSEKAIHYIMGIEHNFLKDFFVRVEYYYKNYYDRVVNDPELDYSNNGLRKVQGIDIFFQKKISKKWDGWITYSYLDAKDKIIKRANPESFGKSSLDYPEPVGKWYVYEKEREHNLSLVLNYNFSKKWRLAITYRFATGMPYTPIVGAKSFGGDVYVPVYGEYLSKRYPSYHRLDLKLSMPGFVKNMESYIQTINTFNNKNVIRYYYNKDYTKRKSVEMLPFLIIGGMKYNF